MTLQWKLLLHLKNMSNELCQMNMDRSNFIQCSGMNWEECSKINNNLLMGGEGNRVGDLIENWNGAVIVKLFNCNGMKFKEIYCNDDSTVHKNWFKCNGKFNLWWWMSQWFHFRVKIYSIVMAKPVWIKWERPFDSTKLTFLVKWGINVLTSTSI